MSSSYVTHRSVSKCACAERIMNCCPRGGGALLHKGQHRHQDFHEVKDTPRRLCKFSSQKATFGANGKHIESPQASNFKIVLSECAGAQEIKHSQFCIGFIALLNRNHLYQTAATTVSLCSQGQCNLEVALSNCCMCARARLNWNHIAAHGNDNSHHGVSRFFEINEAECTRSNISFYLVRMFSASKWCDVSQCPAL